MIAADEKERGDDGSVRLDDDELGKPMSDALAQAVAAIDREIVRDRNVRAAAAEAERRRIEAEAEERRKKAEAEQLARAREIEAAARTAAVDAGMTPDEGTQLGHLYAQDELAKPLAPVLQAAPAPAPARTIVSSAGSIASVKKLWNFELKDIGALATAYPRTVEVRRGEVLDLLRALENDGATEAQLENAIPGIRAFKRDSVSG